MLSSNGPLRQLSYKLYADKHNTPAYKAIENVGAIVEDFDKSSADLQTFADESCRALVKAKTYHPVIRDGRSGEMLPRQTDGLTLILRMTASTLQDGSISMELGIASTRKAII